MKILAHLEQGSEEWLQARAGKITASRAKDARDRLKNGKPSGKQTAYAAQVAIERVAGRPIDKVFQSWQMKEGHVEEPKARMAYECLSGYMVEEVGAISTDDDQFLYSPDGLIDEDGLLEVKSLFSPERILQIIADEDHSDFIDQCVFGLWLTGRQWIDLAIWCPALEPIGLQLTVRRITRDEEAIQALEDDLMAFAAIVQTNEMKLVKAARANINQLKQAA